MNGQQAYVPNEMEKEKASNGYLMSLIAVMAGMPLPIINLLATLVFYAGNRKGTWYVRWHCTQTLLSQLTILVMNSVGFSWTIAVLTGNAAITNKWVGYMITILLFNLVEFVVTIAAAVRTRRGDHVHFWFWGTLTDALCPLPPAIAEASLPSNPQNDL